MVNQWYNIAFMGTNTGAFYEKVEKKGFNHVVIFYPVLGNESYYHVIHHIKTYISSGYVEKDTFDEMIKDAIAFQVKSKRSIRAGLWWWIPTPDTCVTIAKQILGVRKPFIWSPYQLYKHLIKEHKCRQL